MLFAALLPRKMLFAALLPTSLVLSRGTAPAVSRAAVSMRAEGGDMAQGVAAVAAAAILTMAPTNAALAAGGYQSASDYMAKTPVKAQAPKSQKELAAAAEKAEKAAAAQAKAAEAAQAKAKKAAEAAAEKAAKEAASKQAAAAKAAAAAEAKAAKAGGGGASEAAVRKFEAEWSDGRFPEAVEELLAELFGS